MNIGMNKISEDEIWVCYEFRTSVVVGRTLNEKGKLRAKFEDKYGYCKFNKITEEFVLDKKKTDPYFFNRMHKEVIAVHVKLRKLKRENLGFPQITGIATG